MTLYGIDDLQRIFLCAGGKETYFAAYHRPPENFPDAHVKGEGGFMQDGVLCTEAVLLMLPEDAVDEGVMANGCPFGLACGARGIDDIGNVLWSCHWLRVGMGSSAYFFLLKMEKGKCFWQFFAQRFAGADQFYRSIFQNHAYAVLRESRVDRQIGTSCLDDGKDAEHHLHGAREDYGYDTIRADTLAAQHMCHAVGLFVKLAVAELSVIGDDSRGMGRCGSEMLQIRVDGALVGIVGFCLVEGCQLLLFCRRDKLQLAHGSVRVVEYLPCDHVQVMLYATDHFLIVEAGIVGEAEGDFLSSYDVDVQAVVGLLKYFHVCDCQIVVTLVHALELFARREVGVVKEVVDEW